jgi:hypothetical protein
MWVEYKEACNHMTCCYCRYQFCFVCLKSWGGEGLGFHEGAGCPAYGDPPSGYDNEGFEINDRGLHRDTGYNRAGLDRLGLLRTSQITNAIQHAGPPVYYAAGGMAYNNYMDDDDDDDQDDFDPLRAFFHEDDEPDSDDEEEYLDPEIAYADQNNTNAAEPADAVQDPEEGEGHDNDNDLSEESIELVGPVAGMGLGLGIMSRFGVSLSPLAVAPHLC